MPSQLRHLGSFEVCYLSILREPQVPWGEGIFELNSMKSRNYYIQSQAAINLGRSPLPL